MKPVGIVVALLLSFCLVGIARSEQPANKPVPTTIKEFAEDERALMPE
jgi:hypothetical protein